MADTVDLDICTKQYKEPLGDAYYDKIMILADLLTRSKHAIIFTGAGISTSAKIPDFRGPNGVWTAAALGREAPACVDMMQAQPTPTHEIISEMVAVGSVKYVVSQNVDGLHLRSGVPAQKLSEMHGNTFLERCWTCNTSHLREFDVLDYSKSDDFECDECRKVVPYFCHCTARSCDKCGLSLKDSVIHFEEDLPKDETKRAKEHAKHADLCIAVGSSCTVYPATSVPEGVGQRKKSDLVIVNLQPTPLDDLCTLRLFAESDRVFQDVRQVMGNKQRSVDSDTDINCERETHSVESNCVEFWETLLQSRGRVLRWKLCAKVPRKLQSRLQITIPLHRRMSERSVTLTEANSFTVTVEHTSTWTIRGQIAEGQEYAHSSAKATAKRRRSPLSQKVIEFSHSLSSNWVPSCTRIDLSS